MKVLYALTIFVGAFLLFQVQPLIGRAILPWFGASPSVWTSTLVFFQIMLLVGYVYAHLLSTHLTVKRQVIFHLILVAIALAFLPIIPSPDWKPEPDTAPTLRILLLLGATVGVPYALLATTSPLLQRWLVRAMPDVKAYRLYAISNTGSLLALLTYPLFVERLLPLKHQAWLWSGIFILFAVLVGIVAFKLLQNLSGPDSIVAENEGNGESTTADSEASAEPVRWPRIALWFALSALGTTLLVATTGRMSQDVPAVPFLFILPLSLYLVTFIIAFDSPRWYFRPVFCVLMPLALAGASYEMLVHVDLSIWKRIALYAAALFFPCMCCHGELERSKPDPKHLTLFYLVMSIGGASGGLFAAVLAPRLFNSHMEYGLALLTILVTVMSLVLRDLFLGKRLQIQTRLPAADDGAETAYADRLVQKWPRWWGGAVAGVSLAAAIAFIVAMKAEHDYRADSQVAQERNFYGVLGVFESTDSKLDSYSLYHGHIRHGFQYQLYHKRADKTSYYGEQTGAGLAIRLHPKRALADYPFRIGGIGLGVGTLAAYANDPDTGFDGSAGLNDTFQFYEIDPNVQKFAETYFTYLKDAKERGADLTVSLGDARIVLEHQLKQGVSQQLDVLMIDAFTGDSIPMHLLTDECFQTYVGHLKSDGILAYHVSSRYVDLVPVVSALADRHGYSWAVVETWGDENGHAGTIWVVLTTNDEFLQDETFKKACREKEKLTDRRVLWTDDFSSLFDVLD